jgi:MoaA/NifB/PqqE/SkfB family radical SAM enzyme
MCEERLIPWDLPDDIIREIIGLFPYLEKIIWQGGEILLLDYFKDLLDEANKFPNLHQSIITNGLVITEELAKKLVRENIELTFSIDAVTKELYESIRKRAKFEELIRNIKLVNRLRHQRNFKNMSFRMHAVIMNSNYRELEGFVDFAKEYQFDALHLMPIWGNLNGPENIFYRNDTEALGYIKEKIGKVEKKARDYKIDLLNSLPFSSNRKDVRAQMKSDTEAGGDRGAPEEGLLCHMPWKRLVINPAGNVSPACHCKVMVGNVLRENLSDIWNNEKMQEYRRRIAAKDYTALCNPDCIDGIIAEELRGLRW